MKCFKCKRTEREVMLMKLPVDAHFLNKNLEILGNLREGEHICLPCIGYQFDETFEMAESV